MHIVRSYKPEVEPTSETRRIIFVPGNIADGLYLARLAEDRGRGRIFLPYESLERRTGGHKLNAAEHEIIGLCTLEGKVNILRFRYEPKEGLAFYNTIKAAFGAAATDMFQDVIRQTLKTAGSTVKDLTASEEPLRFVYAAEILQHQWHATE